MGGTQSAKAANFIGEVRCLQKLNQYEFGVELTLMRDGVNENNWDYRNLEDHYLSFVGQPILIAYVGQKIGDGHNATERVDYQTQKKYYSYTDGTAERIVGTLSDDKNDFSLVERDGHTWIVAKGKLFAFYAKELVDKIVRTGRMSVSVETLINEMHMDGDTEVYTSWNGIGVTILGEGVAPAIPGANIARLSAMQDEFKTLKLRAASLQKSPENNAPDDGVTTRKGVKKLNTYSKRQLAELSARFEGYKVLAAGEQDGKVYVALLSKDGAFKSYVIENAAETIVPEKFAGLSVNAVIPFGEDMDLRMDAMEFTDMVSGEMQTRLNAAEEDVKRLNKQLEDANKKVSDMEAFESARRLNAAKDAAKNTLAKFNMNRAEKVADSAIDSILKDVESGLYTNCMKDGKWTGEAEVSKSVYAVCGEEVAKLDAAAAQKNRTMFAWEKFQMNSKQGGGTIGDMLSAWGIDAAKE